MPVAAPRPCCHPGCKEYGTHKGYCAEHQKDRQQYDQHRGSSNQRGYTGAWRRARKVFLSKHPLCAECMKGNKVTAATVVDHIIPHKGNKALFWDESNWQPMCAPCHSSKTLKEDMGKW